MEHKHDNEAGAIEHRKNEQEWTHFALLSAGIGTWDIDPVNRDMVCDERCRELYGFPAGETISYGNILTYVHPEDKPVVTTTIEHALLNANEGRYDVEFRIISADGQQHWLRCIGQAYFNEDGIACRFAGTVQDVSQQARSREKQAIKEQQKLLALLENNRDFVSLSDEAGNVSYVNAAGLKLLGFDNLQDARRHNSEYLMPEEIDRLKNEVNEQLFNRGQWSGEILYRHFKTGEAIPVFGTTMLVYDPLTGISQGRASIARDLREEKALRQRMIDNEQELERLVELRTDELKKANIDLNIVNQNLEQFAYVASHDLQEPLRKINMFSALLQDKYANELNETGVRNLGIIRNAATRMTTLIQDLLAFSRVSRQDHLFERIDMVQVFEQVLADLEVLIQQKNAAISYDPLCCVKGIPLHMTQLFQNLLSNALKFSKTDEAPVIRITSRMMEPEEVAANPQLQNGTTYCEIKVQDNGIGFDQTYARKIFVIFQRLHGRGEYEGSGIGLALCQKIVTAHHGVIYAASAEKQGATFTVILPAYT